MASAALEDGKEEDIVFAAAAVAVVVVVVVEVVVVPASTQAVEVSSRCRTESAEVDVGAAAATQ